jgi:hypothetical protein
VHPLAVGAREGIIGLALAWRGATPPNSTIAPANGGPRVRVPMVTPAGLLDRGIRISTRGA